jgi:hypothetical protein
VNAEVNAEVNADVAASPIVSVLARIEVVLADLPCPAEDERWRGRVADEAALLFSLLKGCFDGAEPDGRDDPDPDGTALAAHVKGMMVRGVPLRSVQRFVRAAAAAAFAELWHRAGPGDATAVLRASRLLDRRRRVAERLLHHDRELPPAPRTMEVV